MKEKLEKAVEVLAERAAKDNNIPAVDTLQLTQAALNVANALRAINYAPVR